MAQRTYIQIETNRGSLLNWISNYLGNREQRVFVGQSYSDVKYVKAGLPQGSVLGPLNYVLFLSTHQLFGIIVLNMKRTALKERKT